MIHRDEYWAQAQAAAAYLESKGLAPVDCVLQCGSGLSPLIEALGGRHPQTLPAVPLEKIPHLPGTAVRGHGKNAVLCEIGARRVLVFSGRLHLYEGHAPLTVAFPAAIAKACGAKLFIATNAAGALNQHMLTGEALLHSDFINYQQAYAIAELKCDDPAERFVDPKPAYDAQASLALGQALQSAGLKVHGGTYISVRGPLFETRAELMMLRSFGADAVGMSTVPELSMCHFLGLPCAGVSIITNECFSPGLVSHAEVLEQSLKAARKLGTGLRVFFELWDLG